MSAAIDSSQFFCSSACHYDLHIVIGTPLEGNEVEKWLSVSQCFTALRSPQACLDAERQTSSSLAASERRELAATVG